MYDISETNACILLNVCMALPASILLLPIQVSSISILKTCKNCDRQTDRQTDRHAVQPVTVTDGRSSLGRRCRLHYRRRHRRRTGCRRGREGRGGAGREVCGGTAYPRRAPAAGSAPRAGVDPTRLPVPRALPTLKEMKNGKRSSDLMWSVMNREVKNGNHYPIPKVGPQSLSYHRRRR